MALAKDSNLRRLVPIADRVAIEGEPYGQLLSVENVTISNNQVIGSFPFMSLSRAFYVEAITVTSNRQAILQVLIGSNPTQSSIQQVYRFVVNPGIPVVLPIRNVVRPHLAGSPQGVSATWGDFRVRTVLDATATGAYVYAVPSGFAFYDDLNFAADKIMLVIGDSILNGTAGITTKSNSMEWKTRNWFIASGQNTRIINKSVSGSTSGDHETRRALGVYDFPQVDYIHYQLGTNDAGNSVAPATVQANLAAMIAWKQQRYPNAKMIVWGSTPRENSTYETNLIAIRSAQAAAVTAANDPKVMYSSLAAAFDRTVSGNFASSDSAGDHVHPNDASHAAAYGLISTFLTAQNVRL